jgi:capsular polysaccharide biosynthesis protein
LIRLLNSHDYLVRDLLLPTLESTKPAISARSFRELRERVVPAASRAGTTLFVGRADVKYRFIVDQKSLVDYLESIDRCMAVFPEFLTIDEAIALFSTAAAIILPVGSAKFNLAFCQPGTRVVCVMPAGYAEGNMGVTGMIRHMCHALGLDLQFYSCAIEGNSNVLLHSNLLISKSDLRRMRALIEAN